MRNHRTQFASLLVFMAAVFVLMGNSGLARLLAAEEEQDVFRTIKPLGKVLSEIQESYVHEPNLDTVVEGAIGGMMRALPDGHCSFLTQKDFELMRSDTDGEFEGIGVSIQLNEDGIVTVFEPFAGSPASKAGLLPGDLIIEIEGVSTEGMTLDAARDSIRGPRGTPVNLTIFRPFEEAEPGDNEPFEVEIIRGTIETYSIEESRLLEDGVGYIRLQDFTKNSADEVAKSIEELSAQGMKSLVFDMRWNPGGLLTASREVSELFLPEDTLVTYTKGREKGSSMLQENLRLTTRKAPRKAPLLPEDFPVVILVNGYSASAAEIVTGALQFWERAIVVGEKTYGKGSVQTIIPLAEPEGSAIRLTTALYYTPADVTIDRQGILPDVEVEMSMAEMRDLLRQMIYSYRDDPEMRHEQNHGPVTGNPLREATEDRPATVQDTQLAKAVEILKEEPVFERLIAKYHKDTHLTQLQYVEPGSAEDPKRPGARGMDADGEDAPAEEGVDAPEAVPAE